MGPRGRWRGTVPMLLARREPYHIAGADLFERSAPALRPSAAGGHDESLAERMRVPCRPRAGLECDAGALNKGGIRRLKERVDAHSASEPLRRPFRGSLRA